MAPETAARVRTAVAGLSLSVVMPARNEASYLSATLAALMAAADRSEFVVDLVFVDDGSTDGSADVARAAVSSAMPLHVLSPSGVGRFDARTAGLSAAQSDLVLLLDARVRLRPDALRFVHEQVGRGETVWNGHVEVEATNDLGLFWRLLAELAWRDYFDDPRTTSGSVRTTSIASRKERPASLRRGLCSSRRSRNSEHGMPTSVSPTTTHRPSVR